MRRGQVFRGAPGASSRLSSVERELPCCNLCQHAIHKTNDMSKRINIPLSSKLDILDIDSMKERGEAHRQFGGLDEFGARWGRFRDFEMNFEAVATRSSLLLSQNTITMQPRNNHKISVKFDMPLSSYDKFLGHIYSSV
jgi:hypothetical protein